MAPETDTKPPQIVPNGIVDAPLFSGVVRFGFPMVVAMLLHGSFNLVDAFFIGRMDDARDPLAAIGNCDPLLMIAVVFANGIATATVAMIARAKGSGRDADMRRVAGQSIMLTLCISIVFGAIGAMFARDIGYAMGARGNVLDLTAQYLELMFAGTFTMVMLLQLTSILRGAGDARGPTAILITASVLNVIFAPILIYGLLGTPELGLMGAGWATIAARLIGCALASILCLRSKFNVLPKRGEWSMNPTTFRKLLALGIPNSAQMIVRVLAVVALVALVNHAFTTPEDQSEVAAFGLGIRFDMVAMFIAMGWGAAASTYVGQNLGARKVRRAQSSAWIAASCAFVMLLVITGVTQGMAATLVEIFAPGETRVIEIGVEYLGIVSLSYAFAGAGVVLSLALNGAGSTRAPAIIDGLVYGLLIVPATAILVIGMGLDRQAVWYVICGGNIVLAMVYVTWFTRGKWRKIAL